MPLLHSEYSLDFDGSDDYVIMGDVPELDFTHTDAFSTSCWVKNTGIVATVFLMGKRVGTSTGRGYSVLMNTEDVVFVLRNGSGNVITVNAGDFTPTDGSWHHICCTYDGSVTGAGVNIYIDGEARVTTIDSDTLNDTISNSAPFTFGAQGGAILLEPVRIDEGAVYNKELSSAEVQTIYNAGSPIDLTTNGPAVNLVGYWYMGDGDTFPTITDQSASGNDGTMTNMAADDIVVDAPRPEGAYYSYLFDKNNEYVTLGDVLEFQGSDTFSCGCWLKTHDADAQAIISKLDEGNTNNGWRFNLNAGGFPRIRLRASVDGSEQIEVVSDVSVSDGEWHHVIGTYNGSGDTSGFQIYIDGSQVTTSVVVNNPIVGAISSTAPLCIGARVTSLAAIQVPFLGPIQEVSIFDKVLSSTEVSLLYNGGRARDARTIYATSNLVGYWKLDSRPNFPTVQDLSTSGFDGTATNMEVTDIKLDAPGVDFSDTTTSTQSIEFEGDTNPGWVEVGDVLDFADTDPFSVGVWLKTDGTDGGVLVCKMDTGGTDAGWLVSIEASGVLRFIARNIATDEVRVDTQKSYGDDTWHLLVATYAGTGAASGVALFVDGVQVPSSIQQDNLSGSMISAAPLSIGARVNAAGTTTLPYGGLIDDVVIYDKALTEVEVRTLYSTRNPVDILELLPLANLQGYWRMGDGATFPVIPDLSSNGNDGSMSPDLHKQRIVNDRPPGAPSTQYANGSLGALSTGGTPFNYGKADAFSINCWFRTNSGINNYPTVVRHAQNVGGTGDGFARGYFIYIEGFSSWTVGGVGLILANDNTGNIEILVNTNAAYNDGLWHHAVCTYDGSGDASGCSIYVDGSLAASTVRRNDLGATDFTSSVANLNIDDAIEPGTGSTGAVCQVAVYSKELTAGEVTTLYGGGTPPDLSAVGPTGVLEGYWPILDTDLANLPTVADSSGNSRDMAAQDTTESIVEDAPSPLVSTYCVDFDGSDDRVVVGDVLGFERTDPFTLMCWMKRGSGASGFDTLIAKQQDAVDLRGYLLGYDTGTGFFSLTLRNTTSNRIAVQAPATAGFTDTNWHHLAASYDGSSLASGVRLFFDGQELENPTIVEDTLTGTILTAESLMFGMTDTIDPFLGRLDGVAIYDRVLTPTEIAVLGQQLIPIDHAAVGPVDSLVGWWRMGDPGPSVFPTIADLSAAQDNPGTMTNMDAGDIVIDSPGPIQAVPIDYGYLVYTVGPIQSVSQQVAIGYGPNTVGGVSTGVSYKMRALADPGPGYVTWVVDEAPDFAGVEAPSAIQGGTAVVSGSWGAPKVQHQPVTTIDVLQTVSDSATATDPGDGITLVLVDTSVGTWDDLDTITLPLTPQTGAEVYVKDNAGNANVSRIQVASADLIDGQTSVEISNSWGALHFFYNGTEWNLI